MQEVHPKRGTWRQGQLTRPSADLWRAGCIERCTSGSGRHRQRPAQQVRGAGCGRAAPHRRLRVQVLPPLPVDKEAGASSSQSTGLFIYLTLFPPIPGPTSPLQQTLLACSQAKPEPDALPHLQPVWYHRQQSNMPDGKERQQEGQRASQAKPGRSRPGQGRSSPEACWGKRSAFP